MAWIYLAESEEYPTPSGTMCEQSLIAKSTVIVKESSCPEWLLDYYPEDQYGIILQHLKERIFPEIQSTSFMEASHARTLALQDMEKAWLESEAVYFMRSLGCAAKLSPGLSFWRMCPLSRPEEEVRWSEKLPRWGMTVGGALYPLRPLERYTKEKGGFYLPTLQACDASKGPAKEYIKNGKQASMRNLVTISYRIWKAGPLMPGVCERLMHYPLGWSDLEPWATAWYLLRRKKRS